MKNRFLSLVFLICITAIAKAQILTAKENSSYFGWLNQYSLTNFASDNGCVPTCSVNAMTYLQNANPLYFGSNLTGTSYLDWYSTAEFISGPNYLNTSASSGTAFTNIQPALESYITGFRGFTNVQFSQMQSTVSGSNYIGLPTVNFLFNALTAGEAAIFGFINPNAPAGSIGHELAACGLTWDPFLNTGTISFIDPLDPSSNGSTNGPAQVTTGTISYASGEYSGLSYTNALAISYSQYQGRLPYTNNYADAFGLIVSANIIAVPEPSTNALLGLGAIGILMVMLRKQMA